MAAQPRGGRQLRCNLLRDGYEEAAEHIHTVLRHTRGAHVVQIDPDGGVRVRPACHIANDDIDVLVLQSNYIGTFTRMVAMEHLEDCLIDWQRGAGQ